MSATELQLYREHMARLQKWDARAVPDRPISLRRKQPKLQRPPQHDWGVWQTIAGGMLVPPDFWFPPSVVQLGLSRTSRVPHINEIQHAVCAYFNLDRMDLLSVRRTANVVWPRQIAMYLSKELTPRSFPDIGRRFGGRDHTTVLHAVRKIQQLRGHHSELESALINIKGSLNVGHVGP